MRYVANMDEIKEFISESLEQIASASDIKISVEGIIYDKDKSPVQEYSECGYEAALERAKLKKEKVASNVISRFTKDYIPPFKVNTTDLGNGIKKINYSPLRVKIED